MKTAGIGLTFFACFLLLYASCSSIPFLSTSSQAWSRMDEDSQLPALFMGEITVDKSSNWTSIKQEIGNIVPLLFLDHKYTFVLDKSEAVYIVDVKAIEREYMSGWTTKRSVSIEVLLYENNPSGDYHAAQPMVIGRTTSSGSESLSSSRDLQKLLKGAIKKVQEKLAGPGKARS